MKSKILIITLFFVAQMVTAQKYICKNGHVKLYSYTPIEEIEADNRQVVSILDVDQQTILFSLLVKSFDFKKALMQEHFNENYMESDKFPKAKFSGKILNIEEIDFSKDGIYDADVEGDLTIHGVTKQVSVKGTIEIKNGILTAKSEFKVASADYDITIPQLVEKKIAKEIILTVVAEYNN